MKYRVTGIDKVTGKPKKPLIIEAPDEVTALAAAKSEGILAEDIKELPKPLPPPVKPTPSPHPKPPPPQTAVPKNPRPPNKSTGKYPSLEALSFLYRVLAILCGVVAAIGLVIGIAHASRGDDSGIAIAIGAGIFGVLGGVSLVAIAEGIDLAMDIEATLRQIRDRLPKPGDPN